MQELNANRELFRVLEKHPSLAQAVIAAMKALKEKGMTSAGQRQGASAGKCTTIAIGSQSLSKI